MSEDEQLLAHIVGERIGKNMSNSKIAIERNPNPARLQELGVECWPTWSKEVSEFPWTYDEEEVCYFLEGEVEVTPRGGSPVRMGQGDLVRFPAGMDCYWKITRAVRKQYTFP